MSKNIESRSFWWAHLFLLWGLAVAQPLYDVLGRYPEFLVARTILPFELFLLIFSVSVVCPALLVLTLAFLRRLWRPLFEWGLLLTVSGLSALVLLPIIGKLPISAWLMAALAISGSLLSGLAYRKLPRARLYLSFLSPAALVFPGYLLVATPIHKLAFPSHESGQARQVAATESNSGTPSVVLIVFDELALFTLLDEQGQIDAVRFPNFARLAAQSTWFRNATTVAESTHSAVPAILTGRYPIPGLLANSGDHPDNLFTWLAETHRLVVFESITQLCPTRLCEPHLGPRWPRVQLLIEDLLTVYAHLVVPRPWTTLLPAVDQGWGNFRRADWQLERSLAFYESYGGFGALLEQMGGSERPTLYYFHASLPHFPWKLLPSGKLYSRDNQSRLFLTKDVWNRDPLVVEHAFQRYLFQLGFADRQLGLLLDKLQESGESEKSLLVVMSDHGLTFTPGGQRRGTNEANAPDLMRVPMFLRQPGQQVGEVSELNAETVDLLPTLSELMGLPLYWQPDGWSLLGREADKLRKTLQPQWFPAPFVFSSDLETLYTAYTCIDGRLLHHSPVRILGSVDSVVFPADDVVIMGFAASLRLFALADRILVFVDGELVHQGETGLQRQDVADFFQAPELLRSGFSLRFPRSLIEARPNPQVRLFATLDDAFSELNYGEEYPWKEATPQSPSLSTPEDCRAGVAGFLSEPGPLEVRTPTNEFLDRVQRTAWASGPDLILTSQIGSEWLGVPLSELPAARPVAARLRFPEIFQNVDPSGDFVPVEVEATLEEPFSAEAQLVLVALDGVVRGEVRTFEFEGRWKLLAMIPEAFFRAGANRVEFVTLPRDSISIGDPN